MFKGNFMRILGYILFLAAGFILVGMFYNTASLGRVNSYYKENVFPKFKEYNENSEYLDGFITANNGFYDKTPIYTLSNNDSEASEFFFTLNIYRAKFAFRSNVLYFFPAEQVENGFIIEFKNLQYKGEDLMELDRAIDSDSVVSNRFHVYVTYDVETKQVDFPLAPSQPYASFDALMQKDDGTYAKLTSIRVDYIPPKVDGETVKAKTLLMVNNSPDLNAGDGETFIRNDLNVTKELYTIGTDEVAGVFPTEAELQNSTFSYEKLDLSKYNGSVALATSLVIVVVIIGAYCMFVHKTVMAHFQQKRTEKRLAAKREKELAQTHAQDAEFEEVDSDSPFKFEEAPVEDATIVESTEDEPVEIETDSETSEEKE